MFIKYSGEPVLTGTVGSVWSAPSAAPEERAEVLTASKANGSSTAVDGGVRPRTRTPVSILRNHS